ncbi:MAG: phosphate ABC transporter permease PstA [Gammaproteobacteria bacterium]|nr:phosphate ABC transporter permease PstA [Gammaproteobacteria bacterium]
MQKRIYLKRRLMNFFQLSLATLLTAFAVFWLIWILLALVMKGLPGFHFSLFTSITRSPGGQGGLLNAIVGSFLLTGYALLIGVPIGLLTGVWLAEAGRYTYAAHFVRIVNDILLSAPSIIIGLFIYTIYVARVGHFSGWAGAFALAVIVIPVIMRTTEDMFLLIPVTLREAAAALGAPRWKVTTFILLRVARTGILTGILLALARISGETAPLLFTALNNPFWSTDMQRPIANLPSVIFQYVMSPYADWHQLAWTGALLITIWILCINIIVRVGFRQKPPLH